MGTIVDLDSGVRVLFPLSSYLQVKQCLFSLFSPKNADNQSDFALTNAGAALFFIHSSNFTMEFTSCYFLSSEYDIGNKKIMRVLFWRFNSSLRSTLHTWTLVIKQWFDFDNMKTQYFVGVFCLVPGVMQALREPAAFSKRTGCDTEVPYEKVTLAQARKGTPGKACKRRSVCTVCHSSNGSLH